jgi:hypothetical protein
VDEVGRVHVVECIRELVGDVTFVLLFEQIFADEGVEVDVHQFEQDVDVTLVG